MVYKVLNIEIDQGSSFFVAETIKNPSTEAIIDFTNHTLFGSIRKFFNSSNSYTINVAIVNATAGQISLNLNANTSGNIVSGEYVYDVIALDSSNNVTRILEGQCTINPQTTLTPWQTAGLG